MKTASGFKWAVVLTLSWWSHQGAAQTVSIQNSVIAACKTIKVKFQGVPPATSAKGNWISINEAGSPDDKQSYRFKYLPQTASSGVIELSTRGLNIFTDYEVRLFLDWTSTQSFHVAARQSFHVQASHNCMNPAFTFVESAIAIGQPIEFSYNDLKNVASNWVSLARINQTAPNFVKWKRLAAGSDGSDSLDTAGLPAGTYELRLFEDWEGTKEYYVYDRQVIEIQ
jgi:hypothetical protein